jgi:small subunit ribosomal protein S8
MHTDPIADFITRLRNAGRARKARVELPTSKVKVLIAEVLKKEGFIEDFRETGHASAPQATLEVKLRYDHENKPIIGGITRMSKPGLRRYVGHDDIPKIRGGLGIVILTTSKGLMTDREARRQKLGGEALCSVW